MHFELESRRASLGAGELADFSIGPRGSGNGASGLWRAQLGTRWHRELRERALAEGVGAEFEVPVEGDVAHRGWTLTISGRIDQLIRKKSGSALREIKSVLRPLPAGENELRAAYPDYFVQLAAYAELTGKAARIELAELVFVEASDGVVQRVALAPSDRALFLDRLDRVVDFLEQRRSSTERLRRLRFRAPFDELRPGQAEAVAALEAEPSQIILFEAPTGFGKTGVILEFALKLLQSGRFERLVYLTSKSTGQLQAIRTLEGMVESGAGESAPSVLHWQVRAKAEHCVNSVFHCVSEACSFIADLEERWPKSGLGRFAFFEGQPRRLEALRAAGLEAGICPYEITRAALAFNDVWVGDYNYVFAPANRSLFFEQPGFDPARVLLVVDEAHNLPSRAADAHSHEFASSEAAAVQESLRRSRASSAFSAAWDEWTRFLDSLPQAPSIEGADEESARGLLEGLAESIATVPLDRSALGPAASDSLSRVSAAAQELESAELPRLWWSPRPGVLRITCLDASLATGGALREFGAVVLATATPGPPEAFAQACGLCGDPAAVPAHVRGKAPWRDGAYEVACDLRVDTSFQQRARHRTTTAATVEAVHRLGRRDGTGPVAVFFSSYAYAESILQELALRGSDLRAELQPRLPDLAAQAAWAEAALAALPSGALFLVLGSSFAESIDLLGGRVSAAIVVGPALPEVNPVQQARLNALSEAGRDAAFQRVYQIPGMQKVNQALGRLVRAPGQRAKVLLHCRRFAEPRYSRLLAPEYASGALIRSDGDLGAWLEGGLD